jgi:ABC-type nitrate/sulfonate/bicarbonate transport system ATPase subunit
VAPALADQDSVSGTARAGIRVTNLSMTYERMSGSERIRTHALRGVDLAVEANEFVTLIGPSGCGKTTVLKILSGLLTPTGGEVSVGGQPVRGPGSNRATVFQSPGLMPWRKVLTNVTMALEFQRLPKRERTVRATKYLELVGLGAFGDHYPSELSGGMQQRVGLARALATEPDVLLMDEPFGALDELTRGQMQDELLRIWEHERKTVLFVTHSIDEAILLSDRILVMRDGAVTQQYAVPIARPRSRHELLADPVALDLKRELIDAL